MARSQDLLHVRATQIDITELESHLFVNAAGIAGSERGCEGLVENFEMGGLDLNLARRELGILHARFAWHDLSLNGHDVFMA